MKIPLVYPKMPDSTGCMLKRCVAYEKLDGTNIHWCWNRKDKFYAFGTRRDRFPLTSVGEDAFKKAHPGLEEVVSSFVDCGKHRHLAHLLDDFFSGEHKGSSDFVPTHFPKKNYSLSEVVVFTEFFGEKSFAGQHEKDDHKDHYLIDIQVDGKLLSPEQMECDLHDFRWCMPRIMYRGKFTGDFVERVRKGHYKVDEGVVCKGVVGGEVYMCKIKTDSYLESLKTKFKDNWKEYWE